MDQNLLKIYNLVKKNVANQAIDGSKQELQGHSLNYHTHEILSDSILSPSHSYLLLLYNSPAHKAHCPKTDNQASPFEYPDSLSTSSCSLSSA